MQSAVLACVAPLSLGRGRGCRMQFQKGTARGHAAVRSPPGLGGCRGAGSKAPFTRENRHAAKQPNQTGSSQPGHTDTSSSGLSWVRLTCCRGSHQAPHSQAQVVEQPHRVTKERGAAHHLGQLRQQAAHVVALRQGRGCREAGEHITAMPMACCASAGPAASTRGQQFTLQSTRRHCQHPSRCGTLGKAAHSKRPAAPAAPAPGRAPPSADCAAPVLPAANVRPPHLPG